MLACKRLRIDLDGSLAVDYRIENGRVERRTVEVAAERIEEKEWQPLTSEQVSSHVLAGTVVARWLRRRIAKLAVCVLESTRLRGALLHRRTETQSQQPPVTL